tara:strand:- start:413 stop:862 length:450 start_codon:yes stop_codon:yes gene_type:complete
MLHFYRDDQFTQVATNRLGLYDEMTNDSYSVLMSVTSQQTGKTKTFIAITTYGTTKERYISMLVFILASAAGENLTSGVIFLGSTDYPLGFYDVKIYQNTSNTNLDPTGLTQIYSGLMNLQPTDSDTEPVIYSEYATNDSDTDSVYITF